MQNELICKGDETENNKLKAYLYNLHPTGISEGKEYFTPSIEDISYSFKNECSRLDKLIFSLRKDINYIGDGPGLCGVSGTNEIATPLSGLNLSLSLLQCSITNLIYTIQDVKHYGFK